MSESVLKSMVTGALHRAGFMGFKARIYYRNGIARVRVNRACTGILDVTRGCFISWH